MICQRCAKEKSGIHTCTPSDLVRGLEQQVAALRVDAALGKAIRPNYEEAKTRGVEYIRWTVSDIDAAMGEK